MDLSSLDATVHYFCSQGVAQSTQSTYQSALRKFAEFCSLYSIISPFPVSESILCYFSSYLACKTLSPQTIKTYLAGIRHMQIMLGLPEPRAFLSLPRLRLVQSGIQRTHAQRSSSPTKIRLPITPAEEDSGAVVCEIFRSGHIDAVGGSSAMLFWLLSGWGNNCHHRTPLIRKGTLAGEM